MISVFKWNKSETTKIFDNIFIFYLLIFCLREI